MEVRIEGGAAPQTKAPLDLAPPHVLQVTQWHLHTAKTWHRLSVCNPRCTKEMIRFLPFFFSFFVLHSLEVCVYRLKRFWNPGVLRLHAGLSRFDANVFLHG